MTIYDASPYLDGNFAPVTEELTATDLVVTGSIPAELEGRFVRNGPNPRTIPKVDKTPLVPGRRNGARDPPW